MGNITVAIKNEEAEGRAVWSFTNDQTKIIATPDEDVIWTDNTDALLDELNVRHGQSPSGLFYTRKHYYYGQVIVYDKPVYEGNDLAALAEHLAKDGEVIISQISDTWKALEHGIILQQETHYHRQAKLDPKAAQRRRKAQATRDSKKHVTVTTIKDVINSLFSHIYTKHHINFDQVGPYCRSTSGAADYLVNAIGLHNDVFGKDSHREVDAFKNMLAEWKQKQAVNEKAYAEYEKLLELMKDEA